MEALCKSTRAMKKIIYAVFALCLIVSCQRLEPLKESVSEDADLFASMEAVGDTKTVMDENNNVLWSEGDHLVAFMKTTLGLRYKIKDRYVGTTSGGFSRVSDPEAGDDLVSGQELDHNVVLYPYASNTMCLKNDAHSPAESYNVNVVLPQTQYFAQNSFGSGAFPMIAVSSNNELTFRNICGGLKLQFKGTGVIQSIVLEGLGEELISGKATIVGYVDGSAPTIAMDPTAVKSITLDCGDGVQLNEDAPTTFIIAVPPTEFPSGMKVTITDADGTSKTLTNSSANTIKRSMLLTFPVITFNREVPEPDYWAGKKMIWNGDSISYGSWLSSPTKDAYPYLVGNALGMDVYNFAIGGSYAAKPKGSFESFYWDYNKWKQDVAAGLVDTSKKYLVKDYNTAAKPCRIYYYDGKAWKANSETGGWAIVERMKEMVALHPDADVVGIAVGTNDFYTSACPFGSVDGATDEKIEELKQKYEYDESVNMLELGEMLPGMKLLATSYTIAEGPEYTVCQNVPIVPGCEYRVKNGYRSWFLDANKNPLSTINLKDQDFRFVAPEGARYISISLPRDISNTYVYGAISDVEKDLTHSTFCGAIHTICKYIQSNYEGKDIFFVTPIERYQNWCNKPKTPNSLGYTLEDYADAIIEICSYYSIPVIDFYRTAPVDPHVDKSLFGDTDGKYVHPNEAGHRILASVVVDYLKQYK